MLHAIRRLRELGARPAHEHRFLRRWLAGADPRDPSGKREVMWPRRVEEELPLILAELDAMARVEQRVDSAESGTRLLLRLADGKSVESVLLPRDGACVSSQVGCAVGCTFCMTGRSGLIRQLTADEILAQVVVARRADPRLRRVVFMGMGEPSHNFDAVCEAIDALALSGGFPHKNLCFSTVGDATIFERLLARAVKPAVALSLHSTYLEKRSRLVPRGARIEPRELIEAAESYARRTTYPILVQWTLMEGVNDGDDELERLVELFRGKYALVNLIPWNTVEGVDFKRPDIERARAMSRRLHQEGILCKLRRSAAQDVDGACGQLRARAEDGTPMARANRA
ncbi:MAG: RNA methyltransferase [Planctomycetia bacterium]